MKKHSISEITDFLEFLGDAILIVNDASEIIFANAACKKLFAYQDKQMLKLRIDDLMNTSSAFNHSEVLKKYIHSHSSAKEMMARNLMPCINSEGYKFPARISIASIKINNVLYGVATIQDYTTIQKTISSLESDSNRDILTGLYNRRYLQAVLKMNSRVLSEWHAIGVLFLDLDKFKLANDRLGHEAGDTILKAVASRLKDSVRFDDIIFRIGGDEFLIIVNLTEVSDKVAILENISNKICALMSEPVLVGSDFINIGVSIGAGIYPEHNDNLNELIQRADKAMYASKSGEKSVTFVNQLPGN